ncbi:MAG TPA: class II fumarate hydratase [Halomonas sp.]|jgi:fumarate hydratase class II|uniref:class II fumarate hydratase n=1 Tax=Halomonadaceae TaxID=28256 RepID=UPI0005CB9807|nr:MULTISPECIES: class II fumarate hydratase [Halomonas]KJD20375.1 aspartate ammonia-lyase [Halomonas meridiana]MCF2911313.1 class II fumarate hydratase [Halomonas sp. Cn5-12]MCO7241932.1 class II fumarate hydratase [Halomonas sp. Ps84H-12]HBM42454.1 class II fumarate hydratase [Halomonas sp.]|tara:strand:+ start:3055 stop:4431 length:1377 start_codon:yes stop_codon:yes gene_type:complete
MDTRIERDSMGELEVPARALYGAQTQRAINNFPVSGTPMPVAFVHAVARIKLAAARSNHQLGLLDAERAQAIEKAAQAVIDGQHDDHFPIDVFQTGSGTSTNMNVNEVLATLASREGVEVAPNDHVNMGQSSNDVIPTAIHLSAAIAVNESLKPALVALQATIDRRADELSHVVKTGRTHLMDAMPLRMDQELGAWSSQVGQAIERFDSAVVRLCRLAQGGTAVGTGINAPEGFADLMAKELSQQTGLSFVPNDSFFASLASQDAAVELSGQLKGFACVVMKIANDLRWMNSGPLAGLGEIELEALQPGSSIMPGKVNPVIPESAAQAAAQVMGLDTAITVAGQSGNFQLNVMLPLVAFNLLTSITLMSNTAKLLAERAIATFKVREDNLQVPLARNPILVTALNSVIGYNAAAAIAKKAYQGGRPIIDVAEEETDLDRATLERLLDPTVLTQGGLPE